MKKEQAEASVSTEEVAVRALEAPGPNAPPKEVVEIFDDESEGLVASITADASTSPSDADSCAPRVATMPDTSDDWELA